MSIPSILLAAMWCSGLARCSRRSNCDVRLDRALITSQSWTQLYLAPSSFAHEGLTWMGSTATVVPRCGRRRRAACALCWHVRGAERDHIASWQQSRDADW